MSLRRFISPLAAAALMAGGTIGFLAASQVAASATPSLSVTTSSSAFVHSYTGSAEACLSLEGQDTTSAHSVVASVSSDGPIGQSVSVVGDGAGLTSNTFTQQMDESTGAGDASVWTNTAAFNSNGSVCAIATQTTQDDYALTVKLYIVRNSGTGGTPSVLDDAAYEGPSPVASLDPPSGSGHAFVAIGAAEDCISDTTPTPNSNTTVDGAFLDSSDGTTESSFSSAVRTSGGSFSVGYTAPSETTNLATILIGV